MNLKRLAAMLLLLLLLLCGCIPKDPAWEYIPPEETPRPTQLVSILYGYRIKQLQKVYYFNHSTDTPADIYTDHDEMRTVRNMVTNLALTEEVDARLAEETEPGNYESYLFFMENGDKIAVERYGDFIKYDGKFYQYVGEFHHHLHKDEAQLLIESYEGYPPGGKLKMHLTAFDETNTLVQTNPTLHQYNEKTQIWEEVPLVRKSESGMYSVSAMPDYFDISCYRINISIAGTYRVTYLCAFPSGKVIDLESEFTITV